MSTNNTFNTLNRRAFLRNSSLAGGGLLIGFNLFQACKPKVIAQPAIDLATLRQEKPKD